MIETAPLADLAWIDLIYRFNLPITLRRYIVNGLDYERRETCEESLEQSNLQNVNVSLDCRPT